MYQLDSYGTGPYKTLEPTKLHPLGCFSETGTHKKTDVFQISIKDIYASLMQTKNMQTVKVALNSET